MFPLPVVLVGQDHMVLTPTRQELLNNRADVDHNFGAIKDVFSRPRTYAAFLASSWYTLRRMLIWINSNDYSGPRKLDHQLNYSGGPGKGERWQVSASSTQRSRPR
jgi:hypothetical protein